MQGYFISKKKITEIDIRQGDKFLTPALYQVVFLKKDWFEIANEWYKKRNKFFSTPNLPNIGKIYFPPDLKPYSYQLRCIKLGYLSKCAGFFLDMGMGKTFISLSILKKAVLEDDVKKVLVICPKSVVLKWRNDILRMQIPLNVYPLIQKIEQRKLLLSYLRQGIFIINYEALPYLEKLFKDNPIIFDFLIVDESHRVKNLKAKTTDVVTTISAFAKYRFCLSGTPITNTPKDIYTQMFIIDPIYTVEELGGIKDFDEIFLNKDNKYEVAFGKKTEFKKILKGRSIRYTKDQKLKLPPLTKTIIPCPLLEVEIYDKVRHETYLEIAEQNIKIGSLWAKLTKLQQITSGFLYGENRKIIKLNSGKLECLFDFLQDVKEQVVIFAVFQETIKQISQKLKCPAITGKINSKKRQIILDKFHKGEFKHLVIQIRAGGTGIELQNASIACFMELTWTPADIQQAIDRLRRIGQKKPVNVYFFVTENTIDEYMLKKNEYKESIIKEIIDHLKEGIEDDRQLDEVSKNLSGRMDSKDVCLPTQK